MTWSQSSVGLQIYKSSVKVNRIAVATEVAGNIPASPVVSLTDG